MADRVLCGDMRVELRTLKDGSVDMCVTSPPYFGQRAYAGETEAIWGGEADCEHVWGEKQIPGGYRSSDTHPGAIQSIGSQNRDKRSGGRFCQRCGAWYGELGREPEIGMYVDHLLECFREVWRMLSPYGTLWLNLGGCYAGSGGAGGDYNIGGLREGQPKYGPKRPKGYKPLDYIPVPHLVAMALQREGWYWRSTIVWHKPAPMPGSMGTWRWERCRVKVKDSLYPKARGPNPSETRPGKSGVAGSYPGGSPEYEPCPGCPKCEPHGGYRLYYGAWRPTTAHESVFLMSKSNRYYCDQDAVRTAHKEGIGWVQDREKGIDNYTLYDRAGQAGARVGGPWGKPNIVANPTGANARSVQSWLTANLGLDHFAAFSVELAAWAIRAGTSPRGYCPKCNRPWVRVVDRKSNPSGRKVDWTEKAGWPTDAAGKAIGTGNPIQDPGPGAPTITTLGWKATCECGDEPRPGIVLDPFGGSGTVGLAARGLGRSYVLCEISEEYVAMSEARIRKGFTPKRKQRQIAEEVEVEGVGKVTELRLGLWGCS